MVVSFRTYKKCSPNGKVTIYVGKREIVDTVSAVEPIDGLIALDPEYIQGNRKIYAQLVCYFRYGREDDETMGLNFYKEFILESNQLYTQGKTDVMLTKWQSCLLEKLGHNAFPFTLKMSPNCPVSVVLQQKASDKSQPLGVQYFIKVFVGDSETDRSHRRSTVNLGIRKVQYAPINQGIQPCTVVRKDFLLSPDELELEVNLDQQIYHPGDKIAVNISIRNKSTRYVRKIQAKVMQTVQFRIFQTGQMRHMINSIETTEGCPVGPGASLQKVIYLQPNLVFTQNRFGVAVEGHLKRRETNLASTTLISTADNKDVFGITVSYSIKVKLFMGCLGGELSAELPFVLMHPKPNRQLISSHEKYEGIAEKNSDYE